MRKTLFLLLLASFNFTACSPLRHLKKVEAVILSMPPIQIMSAQPDIKPEYMDPMHYSPYYIELIIEEMANVGIKTRMLNPQEDIRSNDPSKLILDLGMVSIEDTRQPIPDPYIESGYSMNIIGGFGGTDKKGQSTANNSHLIVNLTESEMANLIKGDPTSDPVKILLAKGAKTFAKGLQEDVIKHAKKNVK